MIFVEKYANAHFGKTQFFETPCTIYVLHFVASQWHSFEVETTCLSIIQCSVFFLTELRENEFVFAGVVLRSILQPTGCLYNLLIL